ncbi:hypothetical protein M7775_02120 [Sporomusa sphaeroides DSM 2875]|uniref:VgrG-related protein n=1 Tax=Sporomusa sphaeroides TaxID=47679 RepID=UPI00203090C8|nr:hypothetical protein [Sporomusa sphaeroides]MCM0757364.1 hypothetical protein [Sporomusa sphaeroides DSM 2875]
MIYLGQLSERYESNGDPACVSSGAGDAGGQSYGKYQFASRYGIVDAFVQWLCTYPTPEFANYGLVLRAAGPVNSDAFIAKWKEIGTVDPGHFGKLQHEYTKLKYYDAAATNLLNWYEYDISQRSMALKNVLWSNAVQHAPHYGAELFRDAAILAGQTLLDMSDADLIWNSYEVKLTDPSWSSGSPDLRPGLYNRWRRERNEALAMLQE